MVCGKTAVGRVTSSPKRDPKSQGSRLSPHPPMQKAPGIMYNSCSTHLNAFLFHASLGRLGIK
jgi:hypothetical protein